MQHDTTKLITILSLGLVVFCGLLSYQKMKKPLSAKQFVYMDLMVIDERGRSIHGAELKLEDTTLGTTDSHGRWAKMVKIPIGQSITLTANKTRLGAKFQHKEQIHAQKSDLIENQYRLSRVVQVKETSPKLF